MTYDARYRDNATRVRLPMLLPGIVTAYNGKRAIVLAVDDRVHDGGTWAVRLNVGGKTIAVGGPAEATLPVFTEPYAVCACHGDPWPCDDAFAEREREREEFRQRDLAANQCAACGQDRNLGALRYGNYPDVRRYCRRVGCVREAERWTRELHNIKAREQTAREAFAGQMQHHMDTTHTDWAADQCP